MAPKTTGNEATAREVADVLRREDNILVVSHRRPDGDCLGSATALVAGLRAAGKTAASYNASGVPRLLRFIPNIEVVSDSLPEWTPRVTVFVDCGSASRVAPDFRPQGLVINIDHHATNDRFGDLNYIDTQATAVGEQVLALLDELGAEITRDIATSLYVSLVADTGSFRYSNTTERAFHVAARLLAKGVDPAWVCRNLYESRTRQEIELTARCYGRLAYECGGRMVWSELRRKDYEDVGGTEHEPEGLASDIRGIEGVELAILFHEPPEGGLRASLRSKGNVNCAAIAERLGGGGHPAAAGYTAPDASYEQERARVIEEAKARMKAEGGRRKAEN